MKLLACRDGIDDPTDPAVAVWVSRAAEQFGVELLMVELPEALREDIVAAQDLRVMVNVSPDEAAAIVEE